MSYYNALKLSKKTKLTFYINLSIKIKLNDFITFHILLYYIYK
jgi:hypothetical protein